MRKFRPKTAAERLRLMRLDRLIAESQALADKAEALHEVLEGADNPEEYPSQGIVKQAKGEVVWMLDTAIAQQLTRQ